MHLVALASPLKPRILPGGIFKKLEKAVYGMKEIIMELEDLSCPVCAQKVNDALKKVNGVENVDVSFNTGRAKVKFDPGIQSQDQIKKLVEKLGYGVKSIK